MASSDYYWSKVPGFGKMWFLVFPRKANDTAGGSSLIGSVVRDHEDPPLSSTGIFGKTYPEPNHLTTPQIILKDIERNRVAFGISNGDRIILEETFPGKLAIEVDKKNILKLGVANFPSLPVSFSIDYSRMSKVTMEFGKGTVKRIIPSGFISQLKLFHGGDDSRVPGSTGIDISKETIVHQLLLTRQYSVTFESVEDFKSQTDVAIAQANVGDAGIKFQRTTNRKVVVVVDDGNEYLIALNDIDWDRL